MVRGLIGARDVRGGGFTIYKIGTNGVYSKVG